MDKKIRFFIVIVLLNSLCGGIVGMKKEIVVRRDGLEVRKTKINDALLKEASRKQAKLESMGQAAKETRGLVDPDKCIVGKTLDTKICKTVHNADASADENMFNGDSKDSLLKASLFEPESSLFHERDLDYNSIDLLGIKIALYTLIFGAMGLTVTFFGGILYC